MSKSHVRGLQAKIRKAMAEPASLREVAARCGVGVNTLSRIMSGEVRNPHPKTVRAITQALSK
jgi:transcriptional regulator with XRE-family HTH domain